MTKTMTAEEARAKIAELQGHTDVRVVRLFSEEPLVYGDTNGDTQLVVDPFTDWNAAGALLEEMGGEFDATDALLDALGIPSAFEECSHEVVTRFVDRLSPRAIATAYLSWRLNERIEIVENTNE